MILHKHRLQDRWGGDSGDGSGGYDGSSYNNNNGAGWSAVAADPSSQPTDGFDTTPLAPNPQPTLAQQFNPGIERNAFDTQGQASNVIGYHPQDSLKQSILSQPLTQQDQGVQKTYGFNNMGEAANFAQMTGQPLQSMFNREVSSPEAGALSKAGYGNVQLRDTTPNTWQGVTDRDGNPIKSLQENGQTVDQRIAADNVSKTLGYVAPALISAMMPAPMMLAAKGAQALHSYFNQPEMGPPESFGHVLGKFASNLPGYFGAAGSALQGRWGNAVAQAAGKYGATPLSAIGLGTATSAATGGNWQNGASQWGGQAIGQQIGGPAAGAFGRNLGSMFSRR